MSTIIQLNILVLLWTASKVSGYQTWAGTKVKVGNEISAKITVATMDECYAHCQSLTGCIAFDFDNNNGDCRTYDVVEKLEQDNNRAIGQADGKCWPAGFSSAGALKGHAFVVFRKPGKDFEEFSSYCDVFNSPSGQPPLYARLAWPVTLEIQEALETLMTNTNEDKAYIGVHKQWDAVEEKYSPDSLNWVWDSATEGGPANKPLTDAEVSLDWSDKQCILIELDSSKRWSEKRCTDGVDAAICELVYNSSASSECDCVDGAVTCICQPPFYGANCSRGCNETTSDWSNCTAECNGGTQFRTNFVYNSTEGECTGPMYEHQACNTQLCENYTEPEKEACDILNGTYTFSHCYFVVSSVSSWPNAFQRCASQSGIPAYYKGEFARIYDTARSVATVEAYLLEKHPNKRIYLPIKRDASSIYNWMESTTTVTFPVFLDKLNDLDTGNECVWVRMEKKNTKTEAATLKTTHCVTADASYGALCMIVHAQSRYELMSDKVLTPAATATGILQQTAAGYISDSRECAFRCMKVDGCVGFNLNAGICELLGMGHTMLKVVVHNSLSDPHMSVPGADLYAIEDLASVSNDASGTYAHYF